MSDRKSKAFQNRKNGYNCAQAVICAYSELFGLSEKDAFRVSEGFGGGMGGMKETCGAVSAIYMVLGLLNSDGALEKPSSKASTYSLVQQAAEKFKNKSKSTICAQLKGIGTGKPLRSCEGCIEDACDILDEMLKSREIVQKESKIAP